MIETAKLIPSKDVREYMEKQGRVLSDFEKATLIYNHSGMSHAETRESLKELMEITQDVDLKEEIQDRLSFDELCLSRFYENSAGYVFELYVYDSEERKTREYGCYKTGEEAVECGKKRNENFTIYKVPDGSGDEEDDCYLECKATVCFDKQGVIQGFYSREAEWTAKKPENDRERFENAYVDIPHPFRNGDFVRAKYNDRLGDEVGIVECNREDDITEQTHTYRDYSDDSLRVAYVYASARFGHEHVRIVDLEYATPDEEDEKKEILYCAQNLILGGQDERDIARGIME